MVGFLLIIAVPNKEKEKAIEKIIDVSDKLCLNILDTEKALRLLGKLNELKNMLNGYDSGDYMFEVGEYYIRSENRNVSNFQFILEYI